ncbi:uncharacterized protein LOC119736303 [Patiria miniata]|uniref:CxC5 like cysteine cluster associated with KDZ domain-containing protein n=1 Tax=Patiria miniata TaxID=46514 RepID=A0A914AR81_PATMI|nr:uncharacterized protein LOC119736303 [Patiria miniata]
MSRKKKLDFFAFVEDLDQRESAISKYLSSKCDALATNFIHSKLSLDDKLSLLVSKFSFAEVLRVRNCIGNSGIEDSDLLAECLAADAELCAALVALNSQQEELEGVEAAATSTTASSSSTSTSRPTTTTVFAPPVSRCLVCEEKLTRNHGITTVKYFSFTGIDEAKKITLRCRPCNLTYDWYEYGSKTTHWKLYEEQRPAVQASDSVFVCRKLFDFQCSLANHSWVSFAGFAESFNDAFHMSKSCRLTAKQVSSVFYNGEVENELRDICQLDMFQLKKRDGDIEKVIEAIDDLRIHNTYEHPNCHPKCKAKGCGRVFVADGIWKLSFPHCMFKVKSIVSGIPVPSLPNVCTKSPAYGKAFCLEHCTAVEKESIPTDLRTFLKYCVEKKVNSATSTSKHAPSAATGGGPAASTHRAPAQQDPAIGTSGGPAAVTCVKRDPVSASIADPVAVPCARDEGSSTAPECGVLEDAYDDPVREDTISNVEQVLEKIQPSVSSGPSVVDAQGTLAFLQKHISNISKIMAGCIEEKPTSCKKDTGRKARLQKWSRGHLFIVRAGGHIEFFQSLYKSESPSQVFIILLSWLDVLLQSIPPSEWSNIAVVYDNMCHLDNMVVARSPLPLPAPWSHMWSALKKCVDRLHIRNHTDEQCKLKYHPKDHLEEADNTMTCEQTFVWLARFKKIVCAMSKNHHLFYLHRMVKRRNWYTAKCYEQGCSPVLPVVKSVNTK